MNILVYFVMDDVPIVNILVLSGSIHRVGPLLVMQYCTDKMRNILPCDLFYHSRLQI